MIERVEISNWRALDAYGVNFSTGLNLILGRNAVGKSTVLEAICLALVGDSSEAPDFKASVRDRSVPAKVKLIFDSGTSIERTFSAERTLMTSFVRDGVAQRLTWQEATVEIEKLLGANRQFIKRLAYVSEGAIFRYLSRPPSEAVEGQFERLFGIDLLQQYLSSFRDARTRFHREADSIEDVWKEVEIPLDIDEQLAVIERQSSELSTKLRDLEATEQSVTRELAELSALERAHTRINELLGQLTQIFQDAGVSLDKSRSLHQLADTLFDFLSVAAKEANESLSRAHDAMSHADGRMEYLNDLEKIVTDAKQAMHAKTTQPCPICKRPLEHKHIAEIFRDVSQERAKQQATKAIASREIAHLANRVQVLDDLRSRARQIVAELSAYAAQVHAQSPLEIETSVTALNTRIASTRHELTRLQTEKSALDNQSRQSWGNKARLESQRQVATLVQTQRVRQIRLRTGEFLSELMSEAISATISKERETNLTSIKSTLSELWSRFHGSHEDVDFLPTGEISVQRGGTKLAFSQLSGGEKTALLVLSQAVASRALSELDFLLIDEPLEHLDTGNRRSLIGFLVQSAKQGLIKQLIVTTFEESLVRKYLEDPEIRPIYM